MWMVRVLGAGPDVDFDARVEDERVALVERLARTLDLDDRRDLANLLDLEQLGHVRAGLDVVEGRVDAALEVREALEEALEGLRLVLHHLAVLNRRAVEQVVQLDRLVRRCAHLVARRLRAEPKVDVVHELGVERALLVRVEHNVRVALVERPVLLHRPLDHLELLDPPHLDAGLLAAVPPGLLRLGGRLARGLILIGANQCHVGVRNVELCAHHHAGHAPGEAADTGANEADTSANHANRGAERAKQEAGHIHQLLQANWQGIRRELEHGVKLLKGDLAVVVFVHLQEDLHALLRLDSLATLVERGLQLVLIDEAAAVGVEGVEERTELGLGWHDVRVENGTTGETVVGSQGDRSFRSRRGVPRACG